MNENSFVKYLSSEFRFRKGTGIGDDTSIVKTETGFQLITNDILIEGVHFDLAYFSPAEIAARSLGVNLSDIAAMGGRPDYFYLGLGFPQHFKRKKLISFFESLKKECKRWDVDLAGGDLSSSPGSLFVSITMVGTAENPVRRCNAQKGDLIGISRVTGESAMGLQLLKKGIDIPYFTKRHKDPDPEIEKGVVFSKYVNAMTDVSDGLLIDLGRILTASGKGGSIEYGDIPVTDDMRAVCGKYDLPEAELVLSGGEDFALLFTVSPENKNKLDQTGAGFSIIGEVSDGSGIRTVHNGKLLHMPAPGFDHFK